MLTGPGIDEVAPFASRVPPLGSLKEGIPGVNQLIVCIAAEREIPE